MRCAREGFRLGLVHTLGVARRVTCPTFVGREDELARLDAAAQMAKSGGQLVVVAGDAGVGKTRLIAEAVARWRDSGGLAVIGGCVDLGGPGAGYAPLLEVLRGLRTALDVDFVDQLLRDSAPQLLPLMTGGYDADAVRQDAVLAHTLALLEAVGEHFPGLVVVFEDLHWADPSTRDLVAFLARNVNAAKVALVLSYRIDDLHRQHPLRPLLAELSRSPSVEQLTLSGMSRSELTVLLTGVAGAVPADEVVDQILARSDGNPFFAEELFVAGSGAVPATLRDVVLAHVAALPETAQATLREASVLGAAIDDRMLALMTGRTTAEVADTLREAVARHVLAMTPDGCQFRHALVREALYSDVLPGERQRLHAAAASAIDAHPELVGSEHVRWALLAHHWGAAEDQPNAFATSVRAARAAERIGALADAAAHYQRALELWSRVPDPEPAAGMSRSDLLLRAAEATVHAGSPARAVTLVEAALELLDADIEPKARASVLERLGNHRWAACDSMGSGEARAEAVALLNDRPPSEAKACALAALGLYQMLSDRFLASESTFREAIEIADTVGSSTARASALSGLGFALAKLGRVEEGIGVTRESLATAERDGTADDVGRAYVNLTATLLATTDCGEVRGVAVAGLEHARRVGMLASDGLLLACNGAEAHFWLGEWDEALALITAERLLADRPYGTAGAVVVARVAFGRGLDDMCTRHCDLALAATNAGAQRAPEALTCAAQLAARQGALRRRCGAVLPPRWRSPKHPTTCSSSRKLSPQQSRSRRIASSRRASRGSRDPAEAAAAQVVADDLRTRAQQARERLSREGVAVGRDAAAQFAVLEAEHRRVSGELDPDQWASIAAQWDALNFAFPAAAARYREAEAVFARPRQSWTAPATQRAPR